VLCLCHQDSLLATPLIYDLAVLAELAERIQIKREGEEHFERFDAVSRCTRVTPPERLVVIPWRDVEGWRLMAWSIGLTAELAVMGKAGCSIPRCHAPSVCGTKPTGVPSQRLSEW
jgi:hypothetical protein